MTEEVDLPPVSGMITTFPPHFSGISKINAPKKRVEVTLYSFSVSARSFISY